LKPQRQLELFPDLPTIIDPRKRYERYRTYMTKSPRWKAIAERTKRLANYQCQHCGPTCQGTINLQAHHRDYRRLYRERPGIDVERVCGNCHQYISFPEADNDNEPQR
jgi:5-methylcytosine-specific restriction endonuclease McrA